jgi:predicted Mrr-cat superfamily restriction endonuclease
MNIFQIKTQPHGTERIDLFIEQGFVCIGYPGIGDLIGVDKDEIRDRLQQQYKWTGSQLGNHLGIVNAFVNTMKKDDIVLINENEWVHIGKLYDYKYDSNFESEGMCHRRNVDWIVKVKKDTLNEYVRELLRNRSIVTKFKHPSDISELDKVLANNQTQITNVNINEEMLTRAIQVLNIALQSDNEEIRVKASVGLLQYLK